ncbi:MAG: hypothetical protein F4Y84_07245 [Caldilineaceae bacterium SB0665_bin_25]|nr:hypothetical protein [Caldilineaceae bacterium SB0665_bin_25]
MISQEWSPNEEQALAHYLAEQVCFCASGRLDDECTQNYPRDAYFIGNLRPVPSSEASLGDPAGLSWLGELLNKLAPVAFGVEFLLRPRHSELQVEVSLKWACYYRVFPTFSQQRSHHFSILGEDNREKTTGKADKADAQHILKDWRANRQPREALSVRFRKMSCEVTGIVKITRCEKGNSWVVDQQDLRDKIEREISRAQDAATKDPERIRTSGSSTTRINVPESAMLSEENYAEFLKNLTTEVNPTWQWDIRSTLLNESASASSMDHLEIRFEFTNSTQMAENSPNVEPFLFDPSATFRFISCQVVPYVLEQAPRGFRYDRNLWGRGLNCAVEKTATDTEGKIFQTTNTPVFQQPRYVTSNQPEAPFHSLAEAPLPVLERILVSMKEYLHEWDTYRENYRFRDSNWERQFGQEFESDQERYSSEIERFEAGLQLLRQHPDILLAFKLTNEVFRRGPNDSWRLFQIVFLVSQIPGIAALAKPPGEGVAEREKVDIIYFPTGGGKTEAYLGVTVFQCFFDRLRGKTAGVSAWARFPLRLLTVQQMQRFADVLGVADLVRREQKDSRLIGPDVDGFAVGYFVGQGATPNEIKEPYSNSLPDATWSKAMDEGARQGWKKIMRCPSCKTASIVVDFDPDHIRLLHRCTNLQCQHDNRIVPVYVIDDEIYRYLPSVVVGTIDKLAALGNQRKFSLMLGEVDGRCREHGYFKKRCCRRNCRDQRLLNWTPPKGISGPSLFVQDELHLLKEGLGTFDAHYETFTQRLLAEFGHKMPLKIIASSATIEAFERQVEHLYGRGKDNGRVFPAPGPTLRDSFYAETLDYPQRIYVGLIPHNKTIFNAVLELLYFYQRVIQDLQLLTGKEVNPYGGSLKPGTPAWSKLLDLYATSVTYFLSGRDLNSIRTDLDSAVNSDLQNESYRPAEIFELTGSTTTDDVTNILERLQTLNISMDASDIVLATNMISHGVDIDRLNSMVFYGMPRQNAEYIQASSRVGRSHIGVIFACLHPARERDQSHYSFFAKFHEFLGQLIEPVAINRWSKFSVQRTLPGLFMAVLLQLLANRSGNTNPNSYYMIDFVKQEISKGNIRAEQFVTLLQESYAGGSSDSTIKGVFSDEIEFFIKQFMDQIMSAGSHHQFVSNALIPRPMMSLREVDELLEIELDDAGTRWAARSRQRA